MTPEARTLEGRPRLRDDVFLPRWIGLRSTGLSMTAEEFDALAEDRWDRRYRYELINGILIVSPAVSNTEADPNDELGFLLRTYQRTHPQGSALDVTMPERTVPGTPNRRRCDRAIWAGFGRVPDTVTDVPSIVIEFVSASHRDALRDYELKRDEYLSAGVREYWIIDPFRRTMTVYRRGPQGPVHDVVHESGSYHTELLPGFLLPISQLLAKSDTWTRKRSRRKPPAQEAE